MRIVIRSEGKAGEWNLIELQGELFVPEGTYDGKEIGKLSERDGVPILIIGNHYLEGKRVPLKKPLAIINKDDDGSMSSSIDLEDAGERDGDKAETSRADYRLVGVIKSKYIFKNRPKPL